MEIILFLLIGVVLIWALGKKASTESNAVQVLANQLDAHEAAWAFDLAFSGLCQYLDDPRGQLAAGITKKGFLEAATALYQRLKTLGATQLAANKGQYRMSLTTAILRDGEFQGNGYFAVRKKLSMHDAVSGIEFPILSGRHADRVSKLVFDMQDLAN